MSASAVPGPLAERPRVRSAAAALARALLREAGVKLKDLAFDEATDAGPSSPAPRQLVTPPAPQPARHGHRRAQIFQLLEQSGEAGVSIQVLMQLLNKTLRSMHSTMYYYETLGQVWRRRHEGALHYVLSSVCAPLPGVAVKKGDLPPRQVKRPAPPKVPRQQAARAAKVPKPVPQKEAAPVVHVSEAQLFRNAEPVVPPGVKVTQCPSGRDTRFTVEGPVVGEFTRDWLAKRKQSPGKKSAGATE